MMIYIAEYIAESDGACTSLLGVLFFIRELLKIILLILPIGLIAMISTDFVKGVINIEDGKNKILNHVLKRILYTIIIFLIPATIFGVFRVLGLAASITNSESCWTYVGETNVETVKKKLKEKNNEITKETQKAIKQIVKQSKIKTKNKEALRKIIASKNSANKTNETNSTNSTNDTSSSKTNNTKPKALIVNKKATFDNNETNRVKKRMEEAGFKVSNTDDIDKVNPDKYDTLVIPGGHNITPSIYGEKRHERTYGTDINVDRLQIKAVKKFKKAGKPILGICRGEQVVNVALGGTINQHIGWHTGDRKITIKKNSELYNVFSKKEITVHHSHHQAVKKLGKGLEATQWDKDGTIEGYEHKSLPIYGIQWHPDHMGKKGVKFFKYYKGICLKYMK